MIKDTANGFIDYLRKWSVDICAKTQKKCITDFWYLLSAYTITKELIVLRLQNISYNLCRM